MRTFKTLVLAAGVLAGFSASSAALAGTTRIETRPFYGAVVTIEEGVRVFRPLPSTDRVIINPHGATPLSLGFNETYVTERNYNYNYNETSGEASDGAPRYVGGVYGGYGRGHAGRRGHRGGVGGAPAFRGGGHGRGGRGH